MYSVTDCVTIMSHLRSMTEGEGGGVTEEVPVVVTVTVVVVESLQDFRGGTDTVEGDKTVVGHSGRPPRGPYDGRGVERTTTKNNKVHLYSSKVGL